MHHGSNEIAHPRGTSVINRAEGERKYIDLTYTGLILTCFIISSGEVSSAIGVTIGGRELLRSSSRPGFFFFFFS